VIPTSIFGPDSEGIEKLKRNDLTSAFFPAT